MLYSKDQKTLLLCPGGKTEAAIPFGVERIGPYAFDDCRALESVSFPESVTEIEADAFDNCDALKTVAFPESLTSLSYDVFYDCDALKSVYIPKNVSVVYVSVFMNCKSLTDIYFGGSDAEWNEKLRYDYNDIDTAFEYFECGSAF